MKKQNEKREDFLFTIVYVYLRERWIEVEVIKYWAMMEEDGVDVAILSSRLQLCFSTI